MKHVQIFIIIFKHEITRKKIIVQKSCQMIVTLYLYLIAFGYYNAMASRQNISIHFLLVLLFVFNSFFVLFLQEKVCFYHFLFLT